MGCAGSRLGTTRRFLRSIASIWTLFWRSSCDVLGIVSSRWRLRNLVAGGVVLAVTSVLPYLYVAIWGTGLPWYVWGIGAGLVVVTLVLLWRRIARVRAESARRAT